jgi:hypothetical protein
LLLLVSLSAAVESPAINIVIALSAVNIKDNYKAKKIKNPCFIFYIILLIKNN